MFHQLNICIFCIPPINSTHPQSPRRVVLFAMSIYSFVKEQNTISIFPTLGSWLCHERWLFGESLWAQRCPGLFHNLRDGTTLEPYILTLAHWTEVAIRTAARKITDTVFVLGSSRILRRLVCFPAIACPSVQLQFYPVLFPHLSLGQFTSFSAVWQFLLSWAQLFELLFSDAWTRILRFASLASCCCPSWHSSTGKQIKSLCGRDLSGCPATGSVLTWAMKDTLVGWVI